ncbi:unnamed protein product [Oikopleura dioica]|uniref:Uncharacterized protein n=1 Tax=Oikopleura dioica TaxID=34765 RepID=E4XFD5_OIKDI|nr:unnamed protein product [Oikopleura dioica]
MCEDSSNTKIKNGLNTNTPAYTRPGNDESAQQYRERRRRDTTDKDHAERGVHESWEYNDSCYKRDRNYGLFTGNEGRVRGGAIYTRQNPGGQRRGYECPEERDNYPYWHPTPWKDIAVLTSEPSKCAELLDENANRNMKYECVHKVDQNSTLGYKNEADCTALAKDSAFEKDLVWGVPYRTGAGRRAAPVEKCVLLEGAPECKQAPWSRANHLGQTDDSDYFPTYKWELPDFHGLVESQECVLRIRYNVTTNDYLDDFASDTSKGYFAGLESHDDPEVTYRGARLQLALDSAQTGRVFQDRTHVFQLKPRPASVPSDKTIKNLGVRGRRGNIVQAFPSVEYDFSPTILEMNSDDLVHIQWEGSNTNPNSDGEGRQGTDRSNIVPITVPGASIPADEIVEEPKLFADWIWSSVQSMKKLNNTEELELQLASSGFYECFEEGDCDYSLNGNKDKLQDQLNNAPAYFAGNIVRMNPGKHQYLSTRNNNFSNRAQKGTIIVN